MTEQAVTAPHTDASTLMSVISRAATDPNVDVGKMERLFALYTQMDNQRKEQAFNEAMRAAQEKMPRIHKNRENTHKSYKYSTLEELNKSAVPVYTAEGFALSFGTADGAPTGYYRVTCRVSHRDGYSRDYQADMPFDTVGDKGNPNKTAIQGFGSSMSYGRRYLTLMIFNISTTDDEDDDGQGGVRDEYITHDQAVTLTKMMTDNGLDVGVFLKWAGVEHIGDILASRFQRACTALQGKIDAKKATNNTTNPPTQKGK